MCIHIEKIKTTTTATNHISKIGMAKRTAEHRAGLFGTNCLTCQDLIHWEWQMSVRLALSLVHNKSQWDSCQVAEGDIHCSVTNKQASSILWEETVRWGRTLLYLLSPLRTCPGPLFCWNRQKPGGKYHRFVFVAGRKWKCHKLIETHYAIGDIILC